MNNKFDIIEVIGKTYNLEIATSVDDAYYTSMTSRSLHTNARRRFKNAKLVCVNGHFIGQAYFEINGKLLIVPWCYIISMIPC